MSLFAQTEAGISGKWRFVMDTEDGIRNSDADFHIDGKNVTGKWGESDVKGTFSDGKLDLSFPVNSPEAGFTATMKLTGKLDGSELTGQWEFGQYSGAWRAKRKES